MEGYTPFPLLEIVKDEGAMEGQEVKSEVEVGEADGKYEGVRAGICGGAVMLSTKVCMYEVHSTARIDAAAFNVATSGMLERLTCISFVLMIVCALSSDGDGVYGASSGRYMYYNIIPTKNQRAHSP